jgi:LPXTG-site transpeptidase (sortase) family protein
MPRKEPASKSSKNKRIITRPDSKSLSSGRFGNLKHNSIKKMQAKFIKKQSIDKRSKQQAAKVTRQEKNKKMGNSNIKSRLLWLPTKLVRYLPELMIALGILGIGAWALHRKFYNDAIQPTMAMATRYEDQPYSRQPKPVHIYSQWFLDVDIEPETLTNGEWGVSADKANYLSLSSRPGEKGNIVIYGHNKRQILGNIRAFKGYETITLTTEDGLEHKYKITAMHEVAPNDIQYLLPTDNETLTIYTCSGFMDKKRFIVQAKPI